jgi:outer membrane protein assembly factor BamB
LKTQTLLTVPVPDALGDVSTSTFAATSNRSDDSAVLWRAELGGAGHRQRASVDGDLVLAGGQIEDRAAGTVEAFDLATGALVWRAHTASAVKTTPAAAENVVVAAEVSGDLTGFDRSTGEVIWSLKSSDPLRRFAWGSPTVANGMVYLGDQSDLRAVDIRTGEVIWRRTDLSPHHNLVNHSAPLLVDDLLVMGFWPTPAHPIGLDAGTGESVWNRGDWDGTDPFLALKRMLIMGTASYDSQTDTVLMPAYGNTTRVNRTTGATIWTQPHQGGFSPATPVITDAGYVVTVTGHGLRLLERETGQTLWDLPITGAAPFPMASYTKIPHPVIAAPLLVGVHLILPGLDGIVRRIDLEGNVIGQTQLASPIAASLVEAGDRLIAVGVDGNVLALSRDIAS